MINRRLAVILATGLAFIITVVTITTVGPRPVADYSTLLQYLRDSGASVVDKGELGWSFFYDDLEGRRVAVDETTIEVYEYADAQAMEAEASRVHPEGSGLRGKENGYIFFVEWIATPHFYKAGRVIVFYCGDNVSIISLLRNGLGRQFAGR
jgi:hypothetical protein